MEAKINSQSIANPANTLRGLFIEVEPCDAEVLTAATRASNEHFSGEAKLYVQASQLKEMAVTLSGFPSQPCDAREFVLGGFGPRSAGGGMRLRLFCADAAGHAVARVELEAGEPPPGGSESASLALPVEAAYLDTFVEQLLAVASKGSGRAHLNSGISTGWR